MKSFQTPLIAALLLLTSIPVLAQDLPPNSIWEGKLAGLRLVLKISQDSVTKKQIAVYDSPDQKALGLPVSDLKITTDSLSAFSALINGGFKGKFNPQKTEISGVWGQGGGEMPFTFVKVAQASVLKRPQTPVAPFPYLEEKVTYQSADQSIQYGATLTLPKSAKSVPVVILISGSGQQDRDATLFGHQLFWILADHLSRNGIAVLRVDDRGVGQTTGEVMKATSADFAKDVLVGVEFLKKNPKIDAKKIGLIGHSEGGMIAPLVAIQSKDIAYMVSMAGVGIKGMDIMDKQIAASYIPLGLNADEMARMKTLSHLMVKLRNQYADDDQLRAKYETSYLAWEAQQPKALLEKVGLTGTQRDKTLDAMARAFFLPWMQYFLNYDPATTLPKIKIPVLAINGGKDVQVLAEENLLGFKTLLTQAGNKNFETVLLPNLNHLFQTAKTGAVSEYSEIEETISPEALNVITNWLKRQVK